MLEAMLKHRLQRKNGSHLDMHALATEVVCSARDVRSDSPRACDAVTVTIRRQMMFVARMGFQTVLRRAVHAFVQALFISSCCLIAFWLLHAGTQYWRDDGYWNLPKSGLKPYFGCHHHLLGNACPQQQLLYQNLVYMLLVPAVLACSAILLLALSASKRERLQKRGCFQRWMAVMLPPRGFWLRWSDGLTLQDCIIISIWFMINISWFSSVASRNIYQKLTKLHLTSDITSDNPQNSTTPSLFRTAQLVYTLLQQYHESESLLVIKTVYKCVARSLGSVLFPNLTVLFYPVARGSVVLQALNIPYPAAIRYHRWLGHVCLAITSTHALLYWALWTYEGRWLKTTLKQDPDFNNLFGGIAFLFGLALWLTSLECVRRSNYQLFKVMHHLGFWGWIGCAVCHNWYLFWFSLPGLVLYAVDAAYRLHQSAATTSAAAPKPWHDSSSHNSGVQILHAVAAPDLSMCSLIITCSGYSPAVTGFIWLSVPELQRWGTWHPFEYITVPVPAASNSSINSSSSSGAFEYQPKVGMLIHIKAYSSWTKNFVQLVAAKGPAVSLRLQGPYAKRPCRVAACLETSPYHTSPLQPSRVKCVLQDRGRPSGLIMIAGGMGASAVLSVLSELEAAGGGGGGVGDSLPVLLIWVCRSPTEFEFMGPRVLNMAAAASGEVGGGLDLTVRLFLTGPLPDPLTSSAPKPLTAPQQPADQQHQQQCTSPSAEPSWQTSDGNDAGATVQGLDCTSTDTTCSHMPLLLPPDGLSYRMQQPNASVHVHHQRSVVMMSPLCPVAAVGGLWAQAGHKLLIHGAVYAGVFLAVLVARYLSLIRPADPWPTAAMGALHTTLIAAAAIAAGSAVLLLTQLALSRQQQQQQRQHCATTHGTVRGGTLLPYSKVSSNEQHLALDDLEGSKQQQCCSAVDAVAAVALASVRGTVTAAVSSSPNHVGQGLAAGIGSHGAVLQLSVPAVAGVCEGSSWAVELGRPPLRQLVTSWLTGSKRISSSFSAAAPPTTTAAAASTTVAAAAAADVECAMEYNCHNASHGTKNKRRVWHFDGYGVQQYNVYCMGPGPLVHNVMVMCDDVNRQRLRVIDFDRGGVQPVVHLNCIRETWEL